MVEYINRRLLPSIMMGLFIKQMTGIKVNMRSVTSQSFISILKKTAANRSICVSIILCLTLHSSFFRLPSFPQQFLESKPHFQLLLPSVDEVYGMCHLKPQKIFVILFTFLNFENEQGLNPNNFDITGCYLQR